MSYGHLSRALETELTLKAAQTKDRKEDGRESMFPLLQNQVFGAFLGGKCASHMRTGQPTHYLLLGMKYISVLPFESLNREQLLPLCILLP